MRASNGIYVNVPPQGDDVPALHSLGGVGSVDYYLSITCMLPARGVPAFTERLQVTESSSGITGCGIVFIVSHTWLLVK